jgi:hypothetical protein
MSASVTVLVTVLRFLTKIIRHTKFVFSYNMVLHDDQQYSKLDTPNARMAENDKICKVDVWPIHFEEHSYKPQILLTSSSRSRKAYFSWNFPNATSLFHNKNLLKTSLFR